MGALDDSDGALVASKSREDCVVAAGAALDDSDGEIDRKLRIINGLSKAAIAVAGSNPGAAAGLATAAASLVEEIPMSADAAEMLDPNVAKGLAKTATAAAAEHSATAPGLVHAAASSAK